MIIALKKVMFALSIGIMSSATFAVSVCYHRTAGSVVASNSICTGAYAPLNVKSFARGPQGIPGVRGPQGIQGIPGQSATFAPTACTQSDLEGDWYFTDAGVISGDIGRCEFSVDSTGNFLGGVCAHTRIDNSGFITILEPGGIIGFSDFQICEIGQFPIFLANGNILTLHGFMTPTKMEAV